jgi:hypothetical protein
VYRPSLDKFGVAPERYCEQWWRWCLRSC